MFVADDGYGFSYFDLSQAEARVVGRVAKIDKWNEQFERARVDGSYDCHRALAAEMFKIPYDEVPVKDWIKETGEHTVRYIAKRCRHGLNYRMGIGRLAEVTGLSFNEASKAYGVYHYITPELRIWWDDTIAIVKRDKMLFNAFGRRFMLLERTDNEDAMESVVAFYPQSTIGDKVQKVWYQSEEDDRWPRRSRIALNVHDALISLGPLDERERCLTIMKKYAEEPIYIHGEPLIIPAETKLSFEEDGWHRWSSMNDFEVEAAA